MQSKRLSYADVWVVRCLLAYIAIIVFMFIISFDGILIAKGGFHFTFDLGSFVP
jgi:hypothetical protein